MNPIKKPEVVAAIRETLSSLDDSLGKLKDLRAALDALADEGMCSCVSDIVDQMDGVVFGACVSVTLFGQEIAAKANALEAHEAASRRVQELLEQAATPHTEKDVH